MSFKEDWEIGILGEDVKIKGRIGWKGYKKTDLKTFGPVVVGGNNIKNKLNLDFSEKKHLSIEKFDESPEIALKKGDILLVQRGNGIGDVGYYQGEFEKATINPTLIIISDFIGDSRFLFYYLASNIGRENVLSLSSGSSIPAIYQKPLSSLSYPKPPLAVQNRIASILSSLDEKIELNRQMNQTLEETAQTLFQEMCLPKGDELPEGWEETGIGKLVKIQNGHAFKSSDFIEKGACGIIKIRNINNNVVDISKTQFVSKDVVHKIDESRFLLQGGDLLIAMTGAEVGKIGLIPKTEKELWLNQRVGCFKEKIAFAKYFLFLLLSTDEYQSVIRNSAMGSAQPNISSSAIEEIKTVIPSDKVIKDFGFIVKPLFEKMLENYAENEILGHTRDVLLLKIMNGEIEV